MELEKDVSRKRGERIGGGRGGRGDSEKEQEAAGVSFLSSKAVAASLVQFLWPQEELSAWARC